jgi:hypothetical protein
MTSKILRTLVAGLALGAAALLPALGQSVYVVTITDLQKQDSYEVMTREQVAELKARIQTEARLLPAAIAAARKAWETSDLTKDKPFQTAGLAARKFRQEGPFNQEMAKKKADKKIERDMERDYDAAVARPGTKKKLSEKEAKKQERDAMRDQLAQEAAELVQKHLEALAKAAP